MRRFWIYTLIFCILLSTPPSAGKLLTASSNTQNIAERMGVGINMGNMLEMPNKSEWVAEARSDYFDDYQAAGFKHVRIPVHWGSHAMRDYPYTVDAEFLDRVEQIVDWSLSRGLITVIDAHHEDWLINDYDGGIERFQHIWEQVADTFKDKPDDLIFELLNEPKGSMTNNEIMDMNNRLIPIIRAANPTRPIMIGGGNSNDWRSLVQLQVPDDKNLIATFHYYDPFAFTHETNGDWGTKEDQIEARRAFDTVKVWSNRTGIPVYVGEFGVRTENDRTSRLIYYDYVSDLAAREGFPFAAWDDGHWFKVYDRELRSFDEELVQRIVQAYRTDWPGFPPASKATAPAFPQVYKYGEQLFDNFDRPNQWRAFAGGIATVNRTYVANGNGKAMRISYKGAIPGYWGVVRTITDDWSCWKMLSFDVRGNNDNSFNIVLTENPVDKSREGEQWTYTIHPTGQWTTIVIPFDKLTKRGDYQPNGEDGNNVLDLDNLSNIQLLQDNDGSGAIQVDNIRFIGLSKSTPQAPLLSAVAGEKGQVTLTWRAADGTETYSIRRAEGSGGFVVIATRVTDLSYTDTNVVKGRKYLYQVVAANDVGTDATNTATVVP